MSSTQRRIKFILLFLLAALILICPSAPACAVNLASSEWRPSRIGTSTISPESRLFVQFKSAGQLAGHGGCNRLLGHYETSGNEIRIGPAGATRMACAEPLMALEMACFSALEGARSFRRDKTKLVLFDAS